MQKNRNLTIIMSVFIMLSVAYLTSTPASRKADLSAISTSKTKISQKGNFTQVYYFHSNVRCSSCLLIENNTKKAIETYFAELLAKDKIGFVSLNYQDTDISKTYVKQFGLYMPSVVIVKYLDGELQDWKNLDNVWKLVQDPESFINYIKDEINNLI